MLHRDFWNIEIYTNILFECNANGQVSGFQLVKWKCRILLVFLPFKEICRYCLLFWWVIVFLWKLWFQSSLILRKWKIKCCLVMVSPLLFTIRLAVKLSVFGHVTRLLSSVYWHNIGNWFFQAIFRRHFLRLLLKLIWAFFLYLFLLSFFNNLQKNEFFKYFIQENFFIITEN